MQHDKGKEVAGKVTGKRKRAVETEKTGEHRKRNRGVVQFFENEAFEVGDDDDDDDDELSDIGQWDFFDDEFEAQSSKANNEPGFAQNVPFCSNEEELSDEELEKMIMERYKPGSNYVTYADDRLITTIPVDENETLPSYKEPTVWKIKCMIGREKQSVFCLMQKYVEFNSLGKKLQIISAFSIEHVKGFIYIEAERISDLYEACNGMSTVYLSRVAPAPKNEVIFAFSVRSKCNEVPLGSWARVKNGRYKGDLTQIISINDTQKKATVKLIPRIDLQVLAEKYGGGVRSKKSAVPPQRFVTSTELKEFRPLIQNRRDRETGLAFEILDGMMLKDGFLYKKVKIDSLSRYGVLPSEAETFKFEFTKNENPDCEEWLVELYGETNKEPSVLNSDKEVIFEVGDLVLFNRKDFGVIVGLEKEENYKILKEGSEGPEMPTVHIRQLKKASFENRFTALDKHKKMISITDTVRVLEGPLEGRQGNVKHIYRGTVFLHDEVEQENNGYFCCKSQICENIKIPDDASKGKGDESSFPSSDDPVLLPKSPLAPEKPWETRGRNSNFKREGQEGFTVGQSLRIRVGSLKGYLCRCLAINRIDVTVKLDSQQKILSVKSEHLVKAHERSSPIPMSDDKDAKLFDLLGNSKGSADWMTGPRTSAGGQRISLPAFPSSDTSAQPVSNSAMNTDNKDEEGGVWRSKATPKPNLTWGISNTKAAVKYVVTNKQVKGSNWGNKPKPEDQVGCSQNARVIWDSNSNTAPSSDATSIWPKRDYSRNEGPFNLWGKANNGPNWGKNCGKPMTQTPAWVKSASGNVGKKVEYWGKSKTNNSKDFPSPGWGKTSNDGGVRSGIWGKKVESPNAGQGGKWRGNNTNKNDSAPAWGKTVKSPNDGQGGSWGYNNNTKKDNNAPAWGKNVETTTAWAKSNMKKNNSGPAWVKNVEKPTAWGNKSNTKMNDSGPAWGKYVETSTAWGKNVETPTAWGNKSNTKMNDSGPSWVKNVEKPTAWGNNNNTKRDNSGPAWGKNVETPTAWGNKSNTKMNDSGPSWVKNVETPTAWGNKSNTNMNDSGPSWVKNVETPIAWGNNSNTKNNDSGQGSGKNVGNKVIRNSGRGSSWVNKQKDKKEENPWDRTNSFNMGRGCGFSDRRGRGGRRGGGGRRGERSGGRGRGGFRGRGGRSCGRGAPMRANQWPGSSGNKGLFKVNVV